jgi:hypothetical protein
VSRRTLVGWILHLYPRAWRDRYGEEVRDLVREVTEQGDTSSVKAALDLFASGLAWRLRTSWRTLAFTGTILAFAGAAVFIANSLEYGQPGTSVATHRAQSGPHVQARPTTQVAKVGPIPPSAWEPTGGINLAEVPDFVPALSGGRVVGFIPKGQLFPQSSGQPIYEASPLRPGEKYTAPTEADMTAQNAADIKTVYGSDLTTVVGHMYPGVGYVALGRTPQPSSTVTTVTGYGFPPTGR